MKGSQEAHGGFHEAYGLFDRLPGRLPEASECVSVRLTKASLRCTWWLHSCSSLVLSTSGSIVNDQRVEPRLQLKLKIGIAVYGEKAKLLIAG